MKYSKKTPPMKLARLIICDVLALGLSLLTFAYFHHVIPQEGGPGTVIRVDDPVSSAPDIIPEDANYVWSVDVTVLDATTRLCLSQEGTVVQCEPSDGLLTGLTASTAVCELLDRALSVGKLSEGSVGLTLAQESDGQNYITPFTALYEDAEAHLVGEGSLATVAASVPSLGIGAKFFDKFRFDGTTTVTETAYVSDSIAVYVSQVEYNGAVCHVADIYLCDVHDYRTVLAKETFGKHFTEPVESMAKANSKYPGRVDAILAINGDYYGTHANSFIVRNGILYDNSKADDDICVLYADGTMVSYYEDSFDKEAAVEKGAWQAWSFGPKLLDNGEIPSSYNSSVSPYNPRTAIGYYEPGHYCFVTVDGRSDESRGLRLKQLSEFFASLGCVDAYNLDGGNTSAMYFNGELTNVRSGNGNRPCSDAIIIADFS